MKRKIYDLERIRKGLKVGVLDIESTDLCTDVDDHGYILCACIKTVNADDMNGPIWKTRIDDKRNTGGLFNDKFVVRELVKKMNSFDLILTWYGSIFDIPMINTRALRHRLLPPVRNFRRDLCFVSRGSLKLTNNRLATVDEFLNGKAMKTRLKRRIWDNAFRGDRKAIAYIVDHCDKDVIGTEKNYKRMMPLLGELRRR